MKKYKAHKEHKQQKTIVRPRGEIEDPSAEILSPSRSWERTDPLQDSFLEKPTSPQPKRDYHRVPRLKFRTASETTCSCQCSRGSDDESSEEHDPSNLTETSPWENIVSMIVDAEPEQMSSIHTTETHTTEVSLPSPRQQERTPPIPIRSKSLQPKRDQYSSLSVSLPNPKTNFLLFSQRCAPSPTSASPAVTTPVFELPADEVVSPAAAKADADVPSELEGSPVERHSHRPAPLNIPANDDVEDEPEASPYSRFTTFVRSSHALNASLSTIAETEEEAASRRSSAQIYELADLTNNRLSAYSGGTSITPRCSRQLVGLMSELGSAPCRNVSTRSTRSTNSTASVHSMFSFEFSNSDTEKIYISPPGGRRESSAPSLTDVSSVDELDFDLDVEPDLRRSRSLSKRDAKLERFFGIRQYSVGSESDTSLNLDANQSSASDASSDGRDSSNSLVQSSYKAIRSPTSLDDLDLSLALENDPYRREIILMHKSILAKSQMKQDAKLEKFFGCGKAQIDVARKASTGSRLAGNADDLKYRSIGW